jgi:hypothetical protein
MTLKEIQDVLESVLLQDGEMDRALYEWEMEEHIDDWTGSMLRSRDEYLFVVDVHMSNVTHQPKAAMLVLESTGTISVNEAARDRMRVLWKDAYAPNMRKLIPSFAEQLKAGELPVHGVKTLRRPITSAKTRRSKRRR